MQCFGASSNCTKPHESAISETSHLLNLIVSEPMLGVFLLKITSSPISRSEGSLGVVNGEILLTARLRGGDDGPSLEEGPARLHWIYFQDTFSP